MSGLPLHLVPEEIEWLSPDGEQICVTPLNPETRWMLAADMLRSKQSFQTIANRSLRSGLRLLKKKAAA